MCSGNISELLTYCKTVAESEGYTSFAKRSGVGREYLYRILSGKANPTASTLSKIASACNCTIQLVKNK